MSDVEKLRQRMRDRASPRNATWYSIRNQDGDKAVLRIFDEIHWLFGVDAAQFSADLAEITAPEIEVQINSPGGDVFDGVAIYNQLRAHPARITTRVDGIAASIASVIVQAGDRRMMMSASQQMIHEAWGLAIGPASEMREFADLLDKQTDVIAGIYAERSGRKAGELRSMMEGETWLSADEAVDAGLADEVIAPDPQASRGKTLHDEISEAMAVVSGVLESAERVDALRAEKGKQLSHVNQESLGELSGQMARLDALLDAEEAGDDVRSDVEREFAKFVATTQGAKP